MKYDAIVIGSRIAGAATAMLLARGGRRVLVVDRATFPSDTISTHIVWQRGVNQLIEWSLGDRFVALDAPPLQRAEMDFGPFTLAGDLPAVGAARYAYAPRRTRLDKMLVDAAAESGAEVREGFTVSDILFDGDRVEGIRGRGKSGSAVVEKAAVVIGADGVHSLLARAVRAPEYNVHEKLACWYYSYWSGLPLDRIRFYTRPDLAVGALPTNDGLACVPVAQPQERFAGFKQDVEANYLAAFDALPELRDELFSGRREERIYGTGDVPNFFRKPYGPGWALVGDAGYHKDPVLAQGISDALSHSAILNRSLEDVFEGRADWNTALAGYEAARNAEVGPIYELNAGFASLHPPPPETAALLAALRGNTADTNRFMGVLSGAFPVQEFFAPDNVARILAAVPPARMSAT
jgi:flavin-dependent dehydrogenase